MSIENEYLHNKKFLENEKEKLAKIEATEILEDENNAFSIEERTEAKNKAIKMHKEDIKETEEILDEIKEELIEFINNGGEVSQMTLDALKEEENEESDEFESINVDFKIVSNDNKVSIEGYVEINDEDAEDVDWYYWTGQGYQSHPYYQHTQEDISGLTDEQNDEIDAFSNTYMEDALWINTVILQSNEDENRTYIRKNCTLIINEGAKMECEIKEPVEYRGDYIVELIPKFNMEIIEDFAEYMNEFSEEFDPWDVDDGSSCVENGHIYFEMSKDYWDEDFRDELMNDVNEEAMKIFAHILTWRLGIYSRYGEQIEQEMDYDPDDEWIFKMSQHVNDSEEELDEFMRSEGFIDDN